MANANWLAIAVAALAGFLVGGIWYGPLFAKAWMKENGFTMESLNGSNMVQIYGTTFLLSLVSAFFVGHMLAHAPGADFGCIMMMTTGIALGFIAPAIGTNYLFARKSLKLFFIDAGYWVAFYAVMGLVFALLGS